MLRSLAALAIGLALAGSARAQDLDAKALARIAAPYVNETTQVVGHVDVQKLDLKKYFSAMESFAGNFAPKDNKEIAAMRDFAMAQKAKLVQAGVRHVLAVVNFSDLSGQNPPDVLVVAPLGKNADVDDLLKLIGQVPGFTAKVENNTLIARFGAPSASEPKKRLEFTEGLEALKDKHIQIIVAPSEDVRQMAEQHLPNLPPQLGGGAITVLTKGVRWVGVGYNTTNLTQQYVIQAKDAATAKDLKALANTGLDSLEKLPELADLRKVREFLDLKQQGDRLTLAVNEKALTTLLQESVGKVRQAAARTQSMNNLKQIGLAMHSYHDARGALPARANFDQNGKPLLSWRVHILPFIEQEELYNQFKLDEPWDSPNNKKLIPRIPLTYRSPLSKLDQDGKTTYLAPTGKGSMFDGDKGVRFTDVTDGLSNTIMLVEANDKKAVFWTQPEDFPTDARDLLAGLNLQETKGFLVAFADGSVRFLSANIPLATLRALFTRNGGETVNDF
jgi:hypothetical protein